MPCSYIGETFPKLIVRDVFQDIPRYYCEKENVTTVKLSKSLSADYLPDKPRNLSSYIMECGSSEKFEIFLEKCKLIERRIIFPKYL